MRKLLILLLALPFVNCDCGDDYLSFVCPQQTECWVDSDGMVIPVYGPEDHPYYDGEYINFSETSFCSLGMVKCDENDEIVCEGYISPINAPADEVCNGIDDNCNGAYDEFTKRFHTDPANTCEKNTGGCVQSQECVNGAYMCRLRTPEYCGVEVCDDRDNDGDGVVDEDTLEEPMFEYPYVYDGPEGTDLIGACRPGKKKCIHGEIVIQGQVLPDIEVCEDGIDNDCDGVVDEIENPEYDAAFSLWLDVSGSNDTYLYNITQGVCDFANSPFLSNSLFQVGFFGTDHPSSEMQIMFGTQFVDSITLCDYLVSEPWWIHRGASEYALEGIYSAHNRELSYMITDNTTGPPAFLIWPEGYKKKVIVFTDEPLQVPLQGVAESDIVQDCQDNDYEVGVFAENYHLYQWNYIVDECGGFTEQLIQSTSEMTLRMIAQLSGEC